MKIIVIDDSDGQRQARKMLKELLASEKMAATIIAAEDIKPALIEPLPQTKDHATYKVPIFPLRQETGHTRRPNIRHRKNSRKSGKR